MYGHTLYKGKGFQSTHPVRGATFTTINQICSVFISIHAPREGCDLVVVCADTLSHISIHAPREGCDLEPRANMSSASTFQSTHPVRGATAAYRYLIA